LADEHSPEAHLHEQLPGGDLTVSRSSFQTLVAPPSLSAMSLDAVARALSRYLAGDPADTLVDALGDVAASELRDDPAWTGDLDRLALADVERPRADRVRLTCAAVVSRPGEPDQLRPCRIDIDPRHGAVTVRIGCGGRNAVLRLRLPPRT
jgi:hypothetical protein